MIFLPYENKEQSIEYFNKLLEFSYKGKIGIISDSLPLIANLSVVENIMLPVSYHKGYTLNELEPKIIDTLKQHNLAHIAYYRKNQLSIFEEFIVKYIMSKFYEPEHIIFISMLRHLFGKDRIKFFELLDFENNEKFVIIENKEFQKNIEEHIKIKQMDFKQWATQNLKA